MNACDRWLVVYDTPDDRRRTRLAQILEDYGDRVQYSVFEIQVEEGHLERLLSRLARIVDKEEDSVRLYFVCASCARRVLRPAQPGAEPWWEPEVYIV